MKKLQVLAILIGSPVFNVLADTDFSWQPVIQINEKESHINWEDSLNLLQSGVVEKVFQYHSLKVTLTLKNGNKYITFEPAIDEIFHNINNCGKPCEDILRITE